MLRNQLILIDFYLINSNTTNSYMEKIIRDKIVKPIYKKEIREIPYCPICGLKLEGSGKDYWEETQYRCNCGFWTLVCDNKLKKNVFKLTRGYY